MSIKILVDATMFLSRGQKDTQKVLATHRKHYSNDHFNDGPDTSRAGEILILASAFL
jgi:hypothetical protein